MATVMRGKRLYYEAFGELKTAYAWSLDPRCRVNRKAFGKRVAAGMPVEQALTDPPKNVGSVNGRAGGERIAAFGESKSVNAWAEDARCRVSRTMLRKRLAAGMAVEDALMLEASHVPSFEPREAFGEKKSIAEWSRDPRCVVSYIQLWTRIHGGWPLEDAITIRLAAVPTFIEVDGVTKSVAAWAQTPGAPAGAALIRQRLADGWKPSVAVTTSPAQKLYDAWGESKTLTGWTKDPRCVVEEPATLLSRINSGLFLEYALTTPVREFPALLERDMADYVEGLGIKIVRNSRTIIKPRELDVFVPDRFIAAEFNGLKWHSEQFVGRTRHFEKWRACRDLGIQLIHVWEDDWLNRRPLVERMLAAKLGRSAERRVNARSTTPGFEDGATEFLNRNHLQGAAGATHHVGLRREGELVAVASFQKGTEPGKWVLARYATSCHVVGGLGKCLAFFTRNVPADEVRTFADNGVSDGGLYKRTGFELVARIKPDYMYVVGNRRVHKSNYRLARFESDPDLTFVEGMTESQLAALNGLPRIWDAGKTVWQLTPGARLTA